VVVGACEVTLALPGNRSLKGKRQVSRSLIARVRNRFNVSVAEIADQERWQILSLGITCVGNDGRHIDEILSKIVNFVEDERQGAVLQHSRIQILRA
jgi:uncharacterized protein YlxP (DUF503 family)